MAGPQAREPLPEVLLIRPAPWRIGARGTGVG